MRSTTGVSTEQPRRDRSGREDVAGGPERERDARCPNMVALRITPRAREELRRAEVADTAALPGGRGGEAGDAVREPRSAIRRLRAVLA